MFGVSSTRRSETAWEGGEMNRALPVKLGDFSFLILEQNHNLSLYLPLKLCETSLIKSFSLSPLVLLFLFVKPCLLFIKLCLFLQEHARGSRVPESTEKRWCESLKDLEQVSKAHLQKNEEVSVTCRMLLAHQSSDLFLCEKV